MHSDTPEKRRLLAGFDQGMSRRLLASDVVRGLAQKHELPQERILATLEALRRIDTSVACGTIVFWPAEFPSAEPAEHAARGVTEHAEAALLQAAIDFAVSRELMTAEELRRVHPARLFRTVVPLVARHIAGEADDSPSQQAA